MVTKISPRREYTLGEIVRGGLIPRVTSVPIATRLVRNGLLKGERVPRGLDGIQYRVKGKDIIKFKKDHYGKKGRYDS